MNREESSSLPLSNARSVSIESVLRSVLDYFSVPQFSVLALQVLLTIFCPPIAIGAKKLFLCDVWLVIWAFLGWISVPKGRSRSLLTATAFIFGAVFLHGALRSSMQPILALIGEGAGSPRFSPKAEFIVGLRLFSWVSAVILMAEWSTTHKTALLSISNKVQDLILRVVFALAVVLILCRIFPSVHVALSDFYNFTIPTDIWKGRVFGIFQSPLEAGATFGLLVLLSMRSEFGLWKVLFLQSIGMLGIWLTGSYSPLLSFLVIAILRMCFYIKSRVNRTLFIATTVAAFNIVVALSLNGFLMAAKFGGGWARSLLWNAYSKELFTRLDFAILGFGFTPFYVDNSYLWIFTRGGLLLFLTFLVIAIDAISSRWTSWNFDQKAVVGYLALTGFALDSIIIRPVALVFIAACVPYFAAKVSTSKDLETWSN